MNNKNRSILLQVAFKEAAAQLGITKADEVLNGAQIGYDVLVKLHETNGVDIDFTPQSRGSRPELPTFEVNGVTYTDYRKSESKSKNPRFPDFKTADGEPVWLTDKNGNATDEGIKLLEAAGLI